MPFGAAQQLHALTFHEHEFGAGQQLGVARTLKPSGNFGFDSARTLGEDDQAIAEKDGFIDVGAKPATAPSKVDLPQPDGPSMATNSPGAMSRLMFRTAATAVAPEPNEISTLRQSCF